SNVSSEQRGILAFDTSARRCDDSLYVLARCAHARPRGRLSPIPTPKVSTPSSPSGSFPSVTYHHTATTSDLRATTYYHPVRERRCGVTGPLSTGVAEFPHARRSIRSATAEYRSTSGFSWPLWSRVTVVTWDQEEAAEDLRAHPVPPAGRGAVRNDPRF